MALRDVLARVDRDLELGHVHPAMQRLASLVAAYPNDLELRARRAALNRRIGNPVEAGRWGFLTEEVTAAEVTAFERALPRAWTRLSALRLRDDPSGRLGQRAARRYRSLIEQVEAEAGGAVTAVADEPAPAVAQAGRSFSWLILGPFLLYVVFALGLLGLAIVGLIALIRAWVGAR
ncbi:DUF6584 family protein [Phytohabitans rumicis]|uniref:Uncharacterized protein n=1 Tax=Phytohabitans rumicis TaxID=1076125 RepID=A0A6V8LM95_9ACTN|nr:DUF6584 family protein [Phytohabitans rumicis]GFJ95296.1 hypothetical protein Prum_089380 [Phytohabitans rumicis]